MRDALKGNGPRFIFAWGVGGIADLPGFVPSLRLLVECEKYSLADVALMFGVTRERIRQLCKRYFVITPPEERWYVGMRSCRVWDDAANRFRPVHRNVLRNRAAAGVAAAKREEREARRRARQAEIVARVRALKERLGRDPSWSELYECVLGRAAESTRKEAWIPAVLNRWDARSSRSSAERLREFRQATGTQRRPASAWKPRRVECGSDRPSRKHA